MAFRARGFGQVDVKRVVETHYDDVLVYCRRHTQTIDEAQDATQEVFLRFVRTADRYRDAGKPLAYLLTIARNVCIDFDRARPRSCVELPAEDVLAAPESPRNPGGAYGEAIGEAIALRRALASLSADMREVLELRFDQELKLVDIARVLGISRFAARRRVDAALAALRAQMDVGGEESW